MEKEPLSFKTMGVIEKIQHIENLQYLKIPTPAIKQQLKLSRHDLSHLLRISRTLSDTVKDLIDRNHLSEGHAKALTRLSHQQQDKAIREVLYKNWSVRRLEQEVKAILEGKPVEEDNNYYEMLSENISAQIGHPVQVVPSPKDQSTGVIEIRYLGFDAFDSIMSRLRVRLEEQY